MYKSMKQYIILFLLIISFKFSFSQKYIERADNAFNASEYTNAIALYKNAYNKITDDPEMKAKVAYRTGYCYRRISKPLHAELWLAKSIELLYSEPIVFLYYADALRMNEKYEDAIEQYNKYLELDKRNKVAEKGMKSCQLAQKWTEKPTPY